MSKSKRSDNDYESLRLQATRLLTDINELDSVVTLLSREAYSIVERERHLARPGTSQGDAMLSLVATLQYLTAIQRELRSGLGSANRFLEEVEND